MSLYNPAGATATVLANSSTITIAGMDLTNVSPGMTINLGSRGRVAGDAYIIGVVAPTGTSGGTIQTVDPVASAFNAVGFVIDERAFSFTGSGASYLFAMYAQLLNTLARLTSPVTNLFSGSRLVALDKDSAGAVSRLLYAIAGRSWAWIEQRTLTYTPTGGAPTTIETLGVRPTPDGSTPVDSILIDLSTGGVDVLVASSTMAAATTLDLASAPTGKVAITNAGGGAVSVASLGTGKQKIREVHVKDAGVTFVHDATKLVLPGAANVLVPAGARMRFESNASGVWSLLSFMGPNGAPLKGSITVADISDASENGRSLIKAADYPAMKSLLAIGASDITDASANGRSLITAATYPAMLALLGTDALYTRKRNLIANPGMRVSQENGSSLLTTPNGAAIFPADQFSVYRGTSAGAASIQRVNVATPGGSPNRLRLTVTAALTSPTSNETLVFETRIEGVDTAILLYGSAKAKSSVLRIGVNTTVPGLYSVALRNDGATRVWLGSFTIAAGETNTDVVRTLVVPGDVTGTWRTDNGIGLGVLVTLVGGSSTQGVAGWQGSGVLGLPGTTNLMATNGATFDLFDVGLYEGSVLPPFELPGYDEDVRKCQRYFEVGYIPLLQVPFNGTFGFTLALVAKRAAPVVTIIDGGSQVNVSTFNMSAQQVNAFSVQLTPGSGGTGCYVLNARFSANSRM